MSLNRLKDENFITKDGHDPHFLSDISFWVKRFGLLGKMNYVFILFNILEIIEYLLVVGIDRYMANQRYLFHILIFVPYFYSLHLQKTIPIIFENVLNEYKTIFSTEEKYNEYIAFVEKTFTSKWEKFFSPIVGIGFGSFSLVKHILINFEYHELGNERVILEGYLRPLFMVENVSSAIIFIMVITMIMSSVFMLTFAFKCLNQLGTEQFPLEVSYRDLKIGAFDNIGKFVISFSIPTISLCSFVGMMGWFIQKIFSSAFHTMGGYLFMTAGVVLSMLFIYLLYRNTIDVHKSLTKFKDNLVMETIMDIQNRLEKKEKDYEEIQTIHNFYKEVLKVSDWPFNPASIKKLGVTLSSTLLPLLLSLFGI
jgi:hypothetical protein